MDFQILSLLFGGIGLAVYVAVVFYAGTRALWWLAILVTLPAAMGGLMYLFMPADLPPESPFLFRHFGWAVLGQFTIGALVYLAGRSRSIRKSSEKDL